MNDLTKAAEATIKALEDIASPLKVIPPIPEAGPNEWESITKEDFGDEFDFELYEFEDTTVFYPVSKASLQWCYRFLPDDTPRWRGIGFVIENEWIGLICRQARMDKLVSLDDAEHEENEQRLQREPT